MFLIDPVSCIIIDNIKFISLLFIIWCTVGLYDYALWWFLSWFLSGWWKYNIKIFNTYKEIVFVLFEERCAMISNVLMVPCIGHQVLYTVVSGFSVCLSPFNDECWRFNVFQGFWNLWNKVSTPMKCLVLEFFIDSTKNVFHIFDIYCNNLIIFLFFWKSVLCCVVLFQVYAYFLRLGFTVLRHQSRYS